MKTTISIIVATFNSEATLAMCLSSIIKQKTDEIELILIDGQSTDKTSCVIESFSDHIDHLVSEPDDGIYDAWNKGLELSSGDWLMFVGSDDELRHGCIDSYLEEVVVCEEYDYIAGQIMLVNSDGRALRKFGGPYSWNKFRRNMNLAHVSSLHNRRLYDTYGNYNSNYKICGDYEFLLRPRSSLKVRYVEKLFANMAIGGISFGSQAALVEARDIKLLHQVEAPLIIWLRYFVSAAHLFFKRRVQ